MKIMFAIVAATAAAAGLEASAQLVEIRPAPASHVHVGVIGPGLAVDNDDLAVTTLPLSGGLSASVPNVTASATYTLNQAAFDVDFTSSHTDVASPLASFDAETVINFKALVAIRWTLTGTHDYSGSTAEFIELRSSLRDMTVGVDLTNIVIRSLNTPTASLNLATGGGNTTNTLGPVSGELLAGRDYRFVGDAFMVNGAGFPISGASVGGYTLTFEEIPSPGAGALMGIAGLAWARRRR